MGNPLFGINVSKYIKDLVGPGVLAATLIRVTPGTRTAGASTSGTNPSTASWSCRGFIDKQGKRRVAGGLEKSRIVWVVLIGDSIDGGSTIPETDDRITIEGRSFQISGPVDRDPAAAIYSCPCTER